MSPATGEHPEVAAVGENSAIRLGLVIVLLVASGAAGAAHWRLGALEEQVKSNITKIAENESAALSARNDAGMAVLEQRLKLDTITEAVKRIERRMDSWEREGRVVEAGARGR